jgi:hypothetical protein
MQSRVEETVRIELQGVGAPEVDAAVHYEGREDQTRLRGISYRGGKRNGRRTAYQRGCRLGAYRRWSGISWVVVRCCHIDVYINVQPDKINIKVTVG